MTRAELDAAGIHDERLRCAYANCRTLNARHGRTFFLATRLLAPEQRPAVHALYGFARMADDILDDVATGEDTASRAKRLEQFAARFFDDSDHREDPVLAAVLDTAHRYDIAPELFADFLTSMRMDLSVADYPDRAALNGYMRGSAEVIGLQLLPVLGSVGPVEEAAPFAAALGRAFQLTNFLRDVDEDLDRGRIYLPADELAAYRVDRDLLQWCHTHRKTEPRVRHALAEQHAITRAIYTEAAAGVAMLAPRSRPCVATAAQLYSEILDRIEHLDFAVFDHRASVTNWRKVQVAGPAVVRAWRARRTDGLPDTESTLGAA